MLPRYVRGTEGVSAVDDDAGTAAVPGGRHRHLYAGPLRRQDPPQDTSAVVAEHCLGSAAQDGGHPAAMSRELRPAHGIDAAPDPVQSSLANPVRYGLRAEAKLQQLGAGHHAVLPLRE